MTWTNDEEPWTEYMSQHVGFAPDWTYKFAGVLARRTAKVFHMWMGIRTLYLNRVYGDQGIFVRKDIFDKIG